MKKVLGVVVIVVMVIGVVFVMNAREHESEAVHIGIALPLSGPAAFLGESARQAAQMALEDAGSTRYAYELVIEDDAFNPVQTATIAQKFTTVDDVVAMITFGSGTAQAANPIAEAAQVPHIALASDPTVADGAYNFIHWTPAFTQGELMAQELVRRGVTRLAIVDTLHPGPQAITQTVKTSLAGSGVTIVSEELTTVGQTDFRTAVQKIKQANPDMILLEQFSPEIELTVRQLREAGVTTPVTSVEAIAWSGEPSLFEGTWFVVDSKVNEDFKDAYTKRFGSAPKSGATYVYDLVTLIINEQERAGDVLTPEELAARLQTMGSYESPLFGTVPIDDEGFFITPASVARMVDGVVIVE